MTLLDSYIKKAKNKKLQDEEDLRKKLLDQSKEQQEIENIFLHRFDEILKTIESPNGVSYGLQDLQKDLAEKGMSLKVKFGDEKSNYLIGRLELLRVNQTVLKTIPRITASMPIEYVLETNNELSTIIVDAFMLEIAYYL